jgi:hypothetical protein
MPHNIQLFDQNNVNMLSDSDYTSNTQRFNGVTNGIAQPALHNKLFRQTSTVAYAWAQVGDQEGDTLTDTSATSFTNSFLRMVQFAKSVQSKSATFTAPKADKGALYICTGTFTINFTASGTLGNKWYCVIKNNGSGVVTLDPNSTETIDNVNTLALNAGEGVIVFCDGSNLITVGRPNSPTGFLYGMTLTNNAGDANNSVDISTGSTRSSDDTSNMALGSTLTKSIGAVWTSGNGGGLDTGAKAALKTYHLFIIQNSSTGAVDALFSLSATSPTMPSGYTKSRRIGAILTDAAGNIRPFSQIGDFFYFKTPVEDVIAGNVDNTASLISLSTPTSIKTRALIAYNTARSGTTVSVVVTDPDNVDVVASGTTFNSRASSATNGIGSANVDVYTNVLNQIRVRGSVNGIDFNLVTFGYVDSRGRI